MVTAELAVALPALVVVLAGCLAVLSAVSLQARCADAAGLTARAAARGDAQSALVALATSVVPGADVTVTVQGDLVRTVVSSMTHPLGRDGPGLAVSAQAVALAGVDALVGQP